MLKKIWKQAMNNININSLQEKAFKKMHFQWGPFCSTLGYANLFVSENKFVAYRQQANNLKWSYWFWWAWFKPKRIYQYLTWFLRRVSWAWILAFLFSSDASNFWVIFSSSRKSLAMVSLFLYTSSTFVNCMDCKWENECYFK